MALPPPPLHRRPVLAPFRPRIRFAGRPAAPTPSAPAREEEEEETEEVEELPPEMFGAQLEKQGDRWIDGAGNEVTSARLAAILRGLPEGALFQIVTPEE